jgi:hypothetical protein
LIGKPLVKLVIGVVHESLLLRSLFALSHEGGVFIALEKSGNFSVSQECIHSLQKARLHDVGLVQDEADFLATATGSSKNLSQVFVEVFGRVFVVDLIDNSRERMIKSVLNSIP